MGIQKAAIFTHDIRGGAFANLGTILARGFQELGTSCDLVVLNANDADIARYPDINVVSLNAQRTILSTGLFARYIREQKPDVIFPMPWYFNVVAIWAKHLSRTHTKVIIGEHNIISLEARIELHHQLRMRYLPLLMRYTYPFGDGLIGVSKDTLIDLTEELKITPRIPMTVIQNPIDLERIQKLAKEPIQHPWLQDTSTPLILTVARLAKQKQLDVLIHAFADLVKTQPARLLILGEGPLRQELEALCKQLQVEDQVAMPGYVGNPYPLMAACDVFVLASAWEGCPIALEEALACGAATVVTDAPGGSKDIVEYGEHGIVVPNKNAAALTQAILKLLKQPELREHYQIQALKRAEDFQYLDICKKYLDFSQVSN